MLLSLLLLIYMIVLTVSITNIDSFVKRTLLDNDDVLVEWKDARQLTIGGLAPFSEKREMPYDRLPLAAKASVTGSVWTKAVESAGVYVEFVTDASTIYINYTLVNSNLNLWNMDTGGVSSVDLLAYDIETNMYRWVTTWGINAAPNYPNNTGILVDGLVFKEPTLFRLNFPLYNRVSDFKIGVPSNTSIFTRNTHKDTKISKTIVYYGTSIAQGASASISSSSYINHLDASNYPRYNFFNFGFSSSGKMELSVMAFLNQIPKVDIFIIDCLPNMNYEEVANNTIPLVNSIRETHTDNPTLPIVLVESTIYGFEWWDPQFKKNQEKKRNTLKAQYDKLIRQGYTGIYYVKGDEIISHQEVSVSYKIDGTHPTDLGMWKMFDFWSKYLNSFNWDE